VQDVVALLLDLFGKRAQEDGRERENSQ
jgi:hypothetical protein